MCSHSHLLPETSLSGSSRQIPVLENKTKEPPASERDLGRETGDQALGLAMLITQLCASALSPLSELQLPPGLKAENSPASPRC